MLSCFYSGWSNRAIREWVCSNTEHLIATNICTVEIKYKYTYNNTCNSWDKTLNGDIQWILSMIPAWNTIDNLSNGFKSFVIIMRMFLLSHCNAMVSLWDMCFWFIPNFLWHTWHVWGRIQVNISWKVRCQWPPVLSQSFSWPLPTKVKEVWEMAIEIQVLFEVKYSYKTTHPEM